MSYNIVCQIIAETRGGPRTNGDRGAMSAANDGCVFRIDTERCSGHGRCYSLAPESFQPDDGGYGTPTGRVESDKQPADLQFIVDSCPEEAISIVPVGAESA